MMNKTKQTTDDRAILQTAMLSAFILASAVTIFVLMVIPRFIHASVNFSVMKSLFIVPYSLAAPEPAEHLQYIVGAILFPVLILGFTTVLRRVFSVSANRISLIVIRNLLATFIVVSAIVLVWYGSVTSNHIYLKINIFYKHPLMFLMLAVITFALILYSSEQRITDWFKSSRAGKTIINILMYGFAFLAGLINIFTSGEITLEPRYLVHFNAVFYAMSQVHAGKTILVDLIHQYGLYPHFLNLIFAATNLSVIKYTFIMAILVAFGMACVAMFLRREVSNALLALGGFSSVVYYSYFWLKPIGGFDHYFQYMPVRFICPAVFVLMVSFYIKKRTPLLYIGISIFASFAVFWNLDTGAIVLASWLLSLFYLEFLERPPREAIKKNTLHLSSVLAIFVCCVGLFVTYIFLRSGELPNLGMAFLYQRYFAEYGFFMIPMQPIAPWNIVILIYALGLTYAVMGLLRRRGTPRDAIVFMLSVLGVGLFSYYQGRSHDWNLCAVWYPALLLITLAADYSLNAFRRNQWRTYPYLVVLVPSVVIFSSAFFGLIATGLSSCPAIYGRITAPGNPVTIEGIRFIAENSHESEPILILSYNAGVYYAESGTVNPLSGPGFGELFLRQDYNTVLSAIEKQKVEKIFVDAGSFHEHMLTQEGANLELMTAVVDNYDAVGAAPSNNIIMYKRSEKYGIGELEPWFLSEDNDSVMHLQYLPDKGILTDGRLVYFWGMDLLTPEFSGTRTYEMLMRPQSKQNSNAIVIDTTPSPTSHRGFYIQCSDPEENIYQLVFGDGKTWLRMDGLRFSSDKWHYLALVIDSNKVSLYDNGTFIAGMRTKLEMSGEQNMMFIGDRPLVGNPFKGEIEEFRISDQALTVTEISNITGSLSLLE